MDRVRRKEKADRAHELQIRSGILGGLKATTYGVLFTSLGHYTWPFFRRQTLAFKGFLISTCSIFGLVVGADRALLAHELEERIAEDRLRREARRDLAREGKIATEPEIARWMMRKAEQSNTTQTSSNLKG